MWYGIVNYVGDICILVCQMAVHASCMHVLYVLCECYGFIVERLFMSMEVHAVFQVPPSLRLSDGSVRLRVEQSD